MTREIIYHDEDILLQIEYIKELDDYFLHTTVYNWSLSKAKKYIKGFGFILNQLKKQGITNLKALPSTDKEENWQRFFGFVDSGIRVGKYKVLELDYGC